MLTDPEFIKLESEISSLKLTSVAKLLSHLREHYKFDGSKMPYTGGRGRSHISPSKKEGAPEGKNHYIMTPGQSLKGDASKGRGPA